MRLPALPSSFLGTTRSVAAALGALLVVIGSRAAAQVPGSQLPQATRASALARLPAVPRWKLDWSAATAGSMRREEARGASYAHGTVLPVEWRHVPDSELRLEVPTARLELGRLAISSQLETVPGRERDCVPDCRAPQWSSVLRLQYDAGALGPLRQTTPQLELKGGRPPAGGLGRRFFVAGVGGKF